MLNAKKKRWRKPTPSANTDNGFSPEVMSQLIREAGRMKDGLGLVLWIYLLTGLRLGEGVSLEFSDVDFDKGILTVPAAKSKTHSGRVIPLCEIGVAMLKAMKLDHDKPVPFQEEELTALFKQVREQVGVEGSFHSIRKTTFAWLSRYSNLPDVLRNALMGHGRSENGVSTEIEDHIDEIKKAFQKFLSLLK